MKSAATLVISRNEQPDANFEILVDGKPRSHRDRKDVAIRNPRNFSGAETRTATSPSKTCRVEK
jgi:hypothetical protein